MEHNQHESVGISIRRRLAHKRTPIDAALSKAKRFREQLTSNDDLIRPTKIRLEGVEIDVNTSRFQPKVILTLMSIEEIEKILHSNSNEKNMQKMNFATSQANESMRTSSPELLNIENETVSKSPPVLQANREHNDSQSQVDALDHIKRGKDIMDRSNMSPARSISNSIPKNYKSWQWQPKLRLSKLTENDIVCLMPNTTRSESDSWLQVNPIEFDKEQPMIWELSPQTAAQRFQKRMEEIKKSNQSAPIEIGNTSNRTRAKSMVSKHQLEYEETHKELQTKKRLNGQNGTRRLYSHDGSIEIVHRKKSNELKVVKNKSLTRSSKRFGPKNLPNE